MCSSDLIASAVTITRTELLTPTHLRATPVDGTMLQSAQTKQAYVVQSGVALPAQPQNNPTAASVVAVTIDQSALDNAGTAPAFNHLVSAPARVMLDGGFRTVTTASATTLSWSAPIASSAVTSYDVRIRRATPTSTWGPWTSVASLSGISTTSARIGIPAGATACVSVRAHNRAGQVGPWSSVHCTVRMADDRIATTLSAGWRLTSDPKAFAGTLTADEIRQVATFVERASQQR